jgi:hypothetical protein
MRQRQLEQHLARVTGESVKFIRQRGFSIVESEEQQFERELEATLPHVIDWDA